VVIKSTIPVGHTKLLQEKSGTDRVIFSPEFLREGQALKDNLYPSRIIIGSHCELGRKFANLLAQGAEKEDIELFLFDLSRLRLLSCLPIPTWLCVCHFLMN